MKTEDSSDRPETVDFDLASEIVRYAHDKKAADVVELDLRGIVDYTDRFVIATGRTDRQVKAIADGIVVGLKKEHGVNPRRVEGLPEASWVLVDCWDVIVHIFQPDTRDTYRLEKLWGDAPKTEHADAPVEDTASAFIDRPDDEL
jgi:ribosome-associated protein